jgi:hypothetical protein
MINKYKVHIIWAIVVVIALVGGIMYGKSTGSVKSFAGGSSSSTRGTYAGRGGTSGGSFVTGTIASIVGSDITLQLANGNSEVVLYSSSTPVTEPTIVSVSKLTTGTTIMVSGSSNSDGSLTATTIQVSTGAGAMRGAGGGAGQGTSGTN